MRAVARRAAVRLKAVARSKLEVVPERERPLRGATQLKPELEAKQARSLREEVRQESEHEARQPMREAERQELEPVAGQPMREAEQQEPEEEAGRPMREAVRQELGVEAGRPVQGVARLERVRTWQGAVRARRVGVRWERKVARLGWEAVVPRCLAGFRRLWLRSFRVGRFRAVRLRLPGLCLRRRCRCPVRLVGRRGRRRPALGLARTGWCRS